MPCRAVPVILFALGVEQTRAAGQILWRERSILGVKGVAVLEHGKMSIHLKAREGWGVIVGSTTPSPSLNRGLEKYRAVCSLNQPFPPPLCP